MRIQKGLIYIILIGLVIAFVIHVYLISNNIITNIFLNSESYVLIEKVIAPIEVWATVFVLQLLHIKAIGSQSVISTIKDGEWQDFVIGWNCTGWQSLLILSISVIAVLQYKCRLRKKWLIISAGIIWIFIINIMRITLEVVAFQKAGLRAAIIFHDYLATAFIFLMFSVFWVIIYRVMLKDAAEKYHFESLEDDYI